MSSDPGMNSSQSPAKKPIIKLDEVPADFPRCAVSIGMFDGVHLGHRSLLTVLRSEAARVDGPAVVFTFDRHPSELLSPEHAPLYINTLSQKLDLLRQVGADVVVLATFDHELADLTPEEFVDRIIIGKLKAESVVVGTNFKFGRKRSGDVARLRLIGENKGFRVVSVEPIIAHGAPVSSTRVRNAIARGDVETAWELLGRPFTLEGKVVTGLGLGHKLGYPTANVEVAPRQIVPHEGVYAVEAVVQDKVMSAVCSIGTRPTIGGDERAIEVLIDAFQGNIYGEHIGVIFRRRLRDQIKFSSLESLTDQIKLDVEAAKSALSALKTAGKSG